MTLFISAWLWPFQPLGELVQNEMVLEHFSRPGFITFFCIATACVTWCYWRSPFELRVLLLLGSLQAIWKMACVLPAVWSGHADPAAYHEMGRSITEGRGLLVDHVSWYFNAMPADIVNPENHWPPGISFLIAPSLLLFGDTAFAARVPEILLTSLVIPLAGCRLAAALGTSRWVVAVVGLHLMLQPQLLSGSLRPPGSDLLGCAHILLLTRALVLARRQPLYWIEAALWGGLGPLVKGTGWLFIAPAIVWVFFTHRDEIRLPAMALWRRLILVGLAGAVLLSGHWPWVFFLLPSLIVVECMGRHLDTQPVMGGRTFAHFAIALWICILMPWALRNTWYFGAPHYSTQGHVAAYVGYNGWSGWEQETYRLYWGEDRPTLFDRFSDWERYWKETQSNIRNTTWWLFIQDGERWGGHRKERHHYREAGSWTWHWLYLDCNPTTGKRPGGSVSRPGFGWCSTFPCAFPSPSFKKWALGCVE